MVRSRKFIFCKEMLKFFEDNNVKIDYTYSNLKAVSLKDLIDH